MKANLVVFLLSITLIGCQTAKKEPSLEEQQRQSRMTQMWEEMRK